MADFGDVSTKTSGLLPHTCSDGRRRAVKKVSVKGSCQSSGQFPVSARSAPFRFSYCLIGSLRIGHLEWTEAIAFPQASPMSTNQNHACALVLMAATGLVCPATISSWMLTRRYEIPRPTARNTRGSWHGRKWQLEEDYDPHRRRM